MHEPVLYGGLPVVSFEALLTEGALAAEVTEYGFSWAYAVQKAGQVDAFTAFAAWRKEAAATTHACPQSKH